MRDAIVVGCGIVGATVAAALTLKGLDVLVLDDGRPGAGTPPSGGHLKPSWFGDMKKGEYEPALELLDVIWGLKEEQFVVRPGGGKTTVFRVDTDAVLAYPRTEATVSAVSRLDNYPLVEWNGGSERARLLVVAAGVWAADTFPGLDLVAKRGVSFRFGGRLDEPFIQPWGPYKQIVAHQQTVGEVWVGDGSALLPANWRNGRTAECLRRCREALGPKFSAVPLRKTFGLRPYCPRAAGKPCLLIRPAGKRVWLVTGAGKLGTIAAGWAARKIAAEAEGF